SVRAPSANAGPYTPGTFVLSPTTRFCRRPLVPIHRRAADRAYPRRRKRACRLRLGRRPALRGPCYHGARHQPVCAARTPSRREPRCERVSRRLSGLSEATEVRGTQISNPFLASGEQTIAPFPSLAPAAIAMGQGVWLMRFA